MPLHHNPMARATIAATLLGTTSNIIAQLLQAHNNSRESSSSSSTSTTSSSAKYSLDVIQIVRFAFVVFLTTPPNYLWQALLERLFPAYGPSPGGSSSHAEKRGGGGGGDTGLPSSKLHNKKRTSSNAGMQLLDLEKQVHSMTPPQSSSSSSLSPSPSPPSSPTARDGGARGHQGRTRTRSRKLNWTNTLTKWFIDCITLGALFNTLAFFILTGLLKNQPLSQIAHTVRTETMPLIVAGYRVWPFASIISFTVVPVEKRVVFLNFVGLLWGVYMSFVAARV